PGIKFLKDNSLRLIVGYDTIQVWGYSENITYNLLYIWSKWSNEKSKDKKINSFKIRDDEKGLKISLKLETDDIITITIPKNALSEQMTNKQIFLDNLDAFEFLHSICQVDSIARDNQLKKILMSTEKMLIRKIESKEIEVGFWRFLDLNHKIMIKFIEKGSVRIIESFLSKRYIEHKDQQTIKTLEFGLHVPFFDNRRTGYNVLSIAIDKEKLEIIQALMDYYISWGSYDIGYMSLFSESLPSFYKKFPETMVKYFSNEIFWCKEQELPATAICDLNILKIKKEKILPISYTNNIYHQLYQGNKFFDNKNIAFKTYVYSSIKPKSSPINFSPLIRFLECDPYSDILMFPAIDAALKFKNSIGNNSVYLTPQAIEKTDVNGCKAQVTIFAFTALIICIQQFLRLRFIESRFLLLHFTPPFNDKTSEPGINNTSSSMGVDEFNDTSQNYFWKMETSVEAVYFWLNGRWDYLDKWNFWPIHFLSVTGGFFLVIVTQNMLIAFMSKIYDDIKKKKDQHSKLAIARILSETLSIREIAKPLWISLLIYISRICGLRRILYNDNDKLFSFLKKQKLLSPSRPRLLYFAADPKYIDEYRKKFTLQT
ncbi:11727_t:CDS:2, partial [Ambispora gerdemannii]